MTTRRLPSKDDIRRAYREDYDFFSKGCLKIRTKSGAIIPFAMNEAQIYAHHILERQLQETGRVRAIVVKGRQQGFSTYIAGRFFHKVINNLGLRCFILAHEMEASDNLFQMAKRYHEYLPDMVKPATGASNAKELSFDTIQSGYKVSTAGNKATGRSQTIQLFHGSEAAFWPNDREHAAGVLQAVPDEAGTEVILESTGNGMNNLFYEMAMAAQKGIGDYILIFVPWFMTYEYRAAGQEPSHMSEEDEAYMKAYNLDLEQMAWREKKISELGVYKFRQEYPANVNEAFQASGEDVFISPDIVLEARNRANVGYGAKVLGVDPSGEGKDRTVFVWRHGDKLVEYDTESRSDLMEIVGTVIKHIHDVDAVFIDAIGIGAGIVSRLKELGFGSKVFAVKGSNKPDSEDEYYNKRAECWGRMRDWLVSGASIPNSDDLHADLTMLLWKYDSNGRIRLESKEDLRKRGVPSPDIADALAYTFAYPVRDEKFSEVKVVKTDYNF